MREAVESWHLGWSTSSVLILQLIEGPRRLFASDGSLPIAGETSALPPVSSPFPLDLAPVVSQSPGRLDTLG